MEKKAYDEKIYTEGISTEGGKFAKWFDNFWYHYKWPTIGILFALIVFLVCTIQSCTKEEEDILILYAGRSGLPEEKADGVCDVLEAVMPYDFDENGTKQAKLIHYEVLSEAQMKDKMAETDEAGSQKYTISKSYFSSEYKSFYQSLQTGEQSVLLLDEWLYQELLNEDRLVPLDTVLKTVPETAVDGHGIRVGDTQWYWKYNAAQALPEDTVICLLHPYVAGKSSKPKMYQREKEMFAALVEQPLLEP